MNCGSGYILWSRYLFEFTINFLRPACVLANVGGLNPILTFTLSRDQLAESAWHLFCLPHPIRRHRQPTEALAGKRLSKGVGFRDPRAAAISCQTPRPARSCCLYWP